MNSKTPQLLLLDDEELVDATAVTGPRTVVEVGVVPKVGVLTVGI